MKILITGGKGALGQDATKVFAAHGHEVLALDRDGLDITNEAQVQELVLRERPAVIVNCAAYNLVDKAEDPEVYPMVYAINALGPEYLARAAKLADAVFVHVSTDAVFAGDKPEGYVETDARAPICKYGESKAAGEALIEAVGGKYYIARTTRLFGAPASSADAKESFVSVMLRLAATKPEIQIIDEELGRPTYTPDLARGLFDLVVGEYPFGIYHLVNDGPGVTWYAFAEEAFAIKPTATPRIPVPASAFPKPAARGKFVVLQNTKFPPLRARQAALREFLG